MRLPPPYVNEDWPQSGGYPHHAMHHLAAADTLGVRWRARIGSGTDDDGPALATPVIAGGRVFTMDARSLISSFDAETGARVWTADMLPEEDDEGGFGGGLAVAGGWLFATTGLGHVLALDAETGALQWRHSIGVPVRAPPVVYGGPRLRREPRQPALGPGCPQRRFAMEPRGNRGERRISPGRRSGGGRRRCRGTLLVR